jgi:hypothetical protein
MSLVGVISVASPAQAATGNILPPFDIGQTWYVCQGYDNSAVTHTGTSRYGLDLTGGPNCDNSAAGRNVRSPMAGTVSYYQGTYGNLCINTTGGRSVTLTHINSSLTAGTSVGAGTYVGTVAAANSRENGGVAHIHFQMWASPNCYNSSVIPFDSAHSARICGAPNLTTTGPNGGNGTWSGTSFTGATCGDNSWGGVGSATYFGSHTLTTGQILANNQYLMSDDGRFVLKMQTDGNLVAYGPGGWYWESNTAGYSNAYLKVQTDGNVVLYGGGAARWATGKKGITAFKLQTDGNVVGRNSGGTPVWETDTVRPGTFTYKGSHTLTTSQTLTASNNQFLRSSDKSHFAVMQSDGNFILYEPGYVTYWDSNTQGHPGAYLKVQTDGNVVIYASNGVALWETDTTSITTFKIQTDGNAVGRNADNTPVWASDTVRS